MRMAPPVPPSRVLVVDDAESNREWATWLRGAGHEVVRATSGSDALRIAAEEPVDLVVLDVDLPDMTAYEAGKRIKATAPASVPVLHVSATVIEREELLASVETMLRSAVAQRTSHLLAFRLRRLNDATLAINEAATLEHLVTVIAEEASALFETSAMVTVATSEIGYVASVSNGGEAVLNATLPEAVDAFRRAARQHDLVSAQFLEPFAPTTASELYLAADLTKPGGHRGTLFIATSGPARARDTSDETHAVLEQFARAAASALRSMRSFDVERQIALALQHNLLPDRVPGIDGLDVSVRYRASAEHAEVGGDFYEIFTLGESSIVIAIGDVVGHSLEAAMVMAQLRTGIRSYMLEGHGPTAMLERLNNLLLRFHPDVTATVCCLVFDRTTQTCEIANAGHPPPLIANADGAEYIVTTGQLLGIEGEPAPTQLFVLRAGDVLLLYTDGLIERRRETIDDGLARLLNSALNNGGSLEAFCDRVLREAGPAKPTDDIAMVAIRPTG